MAFTASTREQLLFTSIILVQIAKSHLHIGKTADRLSADNVIQRGVPQSGGTPVTQC
jgi:hypothetical protein